MLARLATITLAICVGFLFAPQAATLFAQSGIPQFIANGMTVISVTIELADGQTIVVPITLDFTVQNSAWGGRLTVDAEVGQQPGMTISVQDDNPIAGGSIAVGVTSTPTAAPIVVVATPTVPPPTIASVVVVPTATALPLPTPTPQISTEELAFLVDVEEILNGYSETSSALQQQFALMSNDVAVIFDQNWTIKTATELAIMAELNRQVNALTIPARFTSLGFELQLMANLLDRAIPAITAGIDNRDAAELGVGVQLVVEASAAMSRARSLLALP